MVRWLGLMDFLFLFLSLKSTLCLRYFSFKRTWRVSFSLPASSIKNICLCKSEKASKDAHFLILIPVQEMIYWRTRTHSLGSESTATGRKLHCVTLHPCEYFTLTILGGLLFLHKCVGKESREQRARSKEQGAKSQYNWLIHLLIRFHFSIMSKYIEEQIKQLTREEREEKVLFIGLLLGLSCRVKRRLWKAEKCKRKLLRRWKVSRWKVKNRAKNSSLLTSWPLLLASWLSVALAFLFTIQKKKVLSFIKGVVEKRCDQEAGERRRERRIAKQSERISVSPLGPEEWVASSSCYQLKLQLNEKNEKSNLSIIHFFTFQTLAPFV